MGDWSKVLHRSASMAQLLKQLERLAVTDHPLLLMGERGTGKSLLAEAVHVNSRRAAKAFIETNCATIPRDLAESVLFGHARGAFTGADKDEDGLFQQAEGGTLFLDEIGELGHDVQAKLLTAVERKLVRKVGGRKEIKVNVRLISATNKDIVTLNSAQFRPDLLDRLGTFKVTVPPLRERREDIKAIVQALYQQERGNLAPTDMLLPQQLSEQALTAFEGFAWPGNVRQLRNAVSRLLTFCTGSEIDEADVRMAIEMDIPRPASMVEEKVPLGPAERHVALEPGFDLAKYLEAERWRLIQLALDQTSNHPSKAAKLLGITRQALHKALKKGSPTS